MPNETSRFNWPYPEWNADWQKWQDVFQDLVTNIDSTVFANMEAAKFVPKALPNVEIVNTGGPDDWELQMKGPAIFISRTHRTEITAPIENVTLVKDSIIGMTLTSGAVGPGTTGWEVFQNGMDVSPEVIPFGYVDGSYNIRWWNGAELIAGGGVLGLFEFVGSGGSSTKVKVSGADTLENYLNNKLVAGANISTTILNPGLNEQLRIDSLNAPQPTADNTYYIDATNGSDVFGDGKIGNPFATLAYAFSAVGQPVNAAAYLAPISFVLMRGTYTAVATIPTYRFVQIKLEEAIITGDLHWYYDPTYLYGLSAAVYFPNLFIEGSGAMSSVEDIEVVNAAPAVGAIPLKTMAIDHCLLNGDIVNEETGHAAVASGGLLVRLRDVQNATGVSSVRIGGRYESVIGYATAPNTVTISAENCNLENHTLCGHTTVLYSKDSRFEAVDYQMDPGNGVGGYSGATQGDSSDDYGMVSTWINPASTNYFGSAVVTPNPFKGDAYTMGWMKACETGGATFTGFAAAPTEPEDWWEGIDRAEGMVADVSAFTNSLNFTGNSSIQKILEHIDAFDLYASDAVIVVSTGATETASGTNLSAALAAAASLTPGGNALSATNRALVLVPAGNYDMGGGSAGIQFTNDYVDMIGMGVCRDIKMGTSLADRVGYIQHPNTVIKSSATNVATFNCSDVRLERLSFLQTTDSNNIFYVQSMGADCVMKDLGFGFGSSVTIYGHGMYCPDAAIYGYWEECHSESDYHYDGWVRGVHIRCSGGDGSFGSSTTGPGDCAGDLIEDCTAGDDSFGSSSSGSDTGEVDGVLRRCVAGDNSFGYSSSSASGDGGIVDTTASLEDCVAGDFSFGSTDDGSAVSGTTECSGTLFRCTGGDSCFGGRYGLFNGDAESCVGGDYCFGSTGTYSAMNGTLVECRAGNGSFGCSTTTASEGEMIRCSYTSPASSSPMKYWAGTIKDCEFEYTGADVVITVDEGAVIYDTTLVASNGAVTETVDSYNGSSTVAIKMAHCRLNKDVHATRITNVIGTGYNVVDVDVEI